MKSKMRFDMNLKKNSNSSFLQVQKKQEKTS